MVDRHGLPADAGPELAALYWRDEILSIVYWWQGEGLGEEIRAEDVAPLLATDTATIERHLAGLAGDGYVDRGDRDGYRLTALGRRAGGQRFAAEFAGLTGTAHGECAPGCDCHRLGPEHCVHRQPQPARGA